LDEFVTYKEEERDCIVCGSKNLKLIWEKKPWSKARLIKQGSTLFHMKDVLCMDCGLIFKNPMLTEESQNIFYDGHYLSLFKEGLVDGISKASIIDSVIKSVYMLDFIKKHNINIKQKNVLEVGSGTGVLLKGLESMGATVKGIDMDKRSNDIAQKLFGIDIMFNNVFAFKEDKKYDIIISCNTIEHFYSPLKFLGHIKQFIDNNGLIIIETPSYIYPYPTTIVDAFLSSAHNCTFSFESFQRLASKAGLAIIDCSYSGHHRSMQIILQKSENPSYKAIDVNYDGILNILNSYDHSAEKINKTIKELFETKNVNTIIDGIFEKFPLTSNQAFLGLAPTLLQSGMNREVIVLMEQYKEEQSEDIVFCRGTSLFYKGCAYRQMGDFLRAKRCFEEAKENYPRFEDYIFIKDLMIDGVISESNFAYYPFIQNKKALESLS